MKLSLSKRERILIVGSLIAIILFVYFSLVLPRLREKIEDQENRLALLRTQLTSKEKAAVRLAQLKEESEALEAYLAASLSDFFGTEVRQEEVLLLIQEFAEESRIDAYELALDENGTATLRSNLENYYKQRQMEEGLGGEDFPEAPPPDPKGEGRDAPDGEADRPQLVESWETPELKMISASIRFRSDYASAMEFIRLISGHSKRIGIESLTLDGSGQGSGGILEGTIRIFLPALKAVEDYYPTPPSDQLEENLENRHRKADPFFYPDRYVEPEETEPAPEEIPETDEPNQD